MLHSRITIVTEKTHMTIAIVAGTGETQENTIAIEIAAMTETAAIIETEETAMRTTVVGRRIVLHTVLKALFLMWIREMTVYHKKMTIRE